MADTLLITALVVLLISAAGTLYFRKRKNRWAGLFQLLLVCSGTYLIYGAVAYFG
jgi:LPXTG-motif cell wall-anchored protein